LKEETVRITLKSTLLAQHHQPRVSYRSTLQVEFFVFDQAEDSMCQSRAPLKEIS